MMANVGPGGGSDAWSIQLTGVDNAVGSIDNSGSSPSKSSSADFESKTSAPSATENSDSKPTQLPDNTRSAPPSVVTRASTVVVTAPGQTKASSPSSTQTSNSSNGPNKAGIAAGVVVGIIALCAFIGGLFFFLRNRKRRALEDEFHRTSANNAAVNAKPTSSSSMSDARLEPSVMMQRRQSDGSIADNQDYSRRILKVSLLA